MWQLTMYCHWSTPVSMPLLTQNAFLGPGTPATKYRWLHLHSLCRTTLFTSHQRHLPLSVWLTCPLLICQQRLATNSVKSFIRLTRITILNYSNTTIKHTVYRHEEGDMHQEDWKYELRRGELPTEPRMRQAFTYWRPAPEVSPDEGFQREAEM